MIFDMHGISVVFGIHVFLISRGADELFGFLVKMAFLSLGPPGGEGCRGHLHRDLYGRSTASFSPETGGKVTLSKPITENNCQYASTTKCRGGIIIVNYN